MEIIWIIIEANMPIKDKLIWKELKQEVLILDTDGGEVIGRIFTPSGTNRDMPNAIQVCGFDEAFSLWGCGGILVDEKG